MSIGVVTTLAGIGRSEYWDGPATSAAFNFPFGIVIDSLENLYISDSNNFLIRKIDVNGKISHHLPIPMK